MFVLHLSKWVTLYFWHPREWFWDWGTRHPETKNWVRLAIDTPFVGFVLNGTLLTDQEANDGPDTKNS